MTDLHVGFSGTRRGMTVEQMVIIPRLLDKLKPSVIHHGDCVGADEEFHILSSLVHIPIAVIHPPTNPDKRAWCEFLPLGFEEVRVLESKDYLVRNQDIVDGSDIIIAAPGETTEHQRSGTWSTMRKARMAPTHLLIVWPTGDISSGDWE
jgi:hypothetical protein